MKAKSIIKFYNCVGHEVVTHTIESELLGNTHLHAVGHAQYILIRYDLYGYAKVTTIIDGHKTQTEIVRV